MQNRIDEVLKAQGKTYKDLVPLTGLSEYGIGKMAQASDDEDLGAWFSLARALHVSPAYLVGWSDDPSDGAYHYDFAGLYKHLTNESGLPRRIPIGGTKITLDNGRVIYSQRSVENTLKNVRISAGDWLTIDGCGIAVDHIASIEEAKVEED